MLREHMGWRHQMVDTNNGPTVVSDGRVQDGAWDEMSVKVLKDAVQGRLRVHTMWGKDVEVLGGPQKFLDTLRDGIKAAETRILISMLDIASGDEEMELLSLLEQACLAKPRLQVLVLLDGCRMHGPGGFRGSRHRLRDLAASLPQIKVLMYRHPYSRRPWPMRLLPHAARQIQGVLHLKAVVVDDSVLITGANLRTEYFHSRQDRYLRLHSRGLSNTYASLLTLLATYSAAPLAPPPPSPNSSPTPPDSQNSASSSAHSSARRRRRQGPRWLRLKAACCATRGPSQEELRMRERLLDVLQGEDRGGKGEGECEAKDEGEDATPLGPQEEEEEEEGDTWVMVDLQLPFLGIKENERLSARLLSCLPPTAHVRLSTGYCNPAEHVIKGLRRFVAQGQVEVLVPCVWSSGISMAGGDQGHKGYERWLAAVYEGVETLLWERLTSQPHTQPPPPSRSQQRRWRPNVRVLEYDREGCNYHAKHGGSAAIGRELGKAAQQGDRLSNPTTPTSGRMEEPSTPQHDGGRGEEGGEGREGVCVTMAGSSNFDQRGFERDVESEVLVLTCSGDLRWRLGGEWARLTSHASTIGEEQWRQRRQGPLGGGAKRCCIQGVLGCVGSYL